MYTFYRHPALLDDEVAGPSGPVAWGTRFPCGKLVTILPPRPGTPAAVCGTAATSRC